MFLFKKKSPSELLELPKMEELLKEIPEMKLPVAPEQQKESPQTQKYYYPQQTIETQRPDVPKPPVDKPIPKKPKPQVDEPIAELYVKINRYNEIVAVIGQLKNLLSLIKSSMKAIERTEKVQKESYSLIAKSVSRLEERINYLSSKLRPIEERPKIQEYYQEEKTEIENTLEGLRKEIESLKSELQALA